MTLFIWPFLLGLGKVLLPNLIRTAVPLVANWAIGKIVGPPQAPQRAATYDAFEDEHEDEDDFEDEDEDHE